VGGGAVEEEEKARGGVEKVVVEPEEVGEAGVATGEE
jgi:hypothetical protein